MRNWNSVKKRIFVNKPIEDVYRCWATKSILETWFLEKSDFKSNNKQRKLNELVHKGDKFEWKWNNWDFTEKGEILEANGKDSISFTFGSGGKVHIILKTIDAGTEITLIQDDIPTDEKNKMDIFVGCITGWTFWLTNLKAYLEYGITLHSKGLKQDDTTDLVNC